MMGFAGQLSLGHAIYVGLGGYAAAALYVHFGIGPWIGLARRRSPSRRPAARSSAFSRSASASAASISPSSPSLSPNSRASASTISAGSAARAACSCRSRNYAAERSLEPARQADHVLLRDPGAARSRAFVLCHALLRSRGRLLLAGDPRGRGGRARARHRYLPLQDVCGADLRRHDLGRRRVLRVLLQQSFSRAGVQHRALDRDHPRPDHRRRRHARSARSSAPSCSPALPRPCGNCLRALGLGRARHAPGVLRLAAAGGHHRSARRACGRGWPGCIGLEKPRS